MCVEAKTVSETSLHAWKHIGAGSHALLRFCFVLIGVSGDLQLDQELMNRHGEKERLTSVPILCRITLQNAP